MAHEENIMDPKSIDDLSSEMVDGNKVMGGGFGDAGMIEDGVNTVLDPFTAPTDIAPQDFIPPVDGAPGPVPFDGNGPLGGPLDHGPLGHDLPHGPGPI